MFFHIGLLSSMATVVTYLLVSAPNDPDAVCDHSLLEEHGFEREPMEGREDDESLPALKFSVAHALEEKPSLKEPCRTLSAAFPDATITFCEVEERFDQVEHLQSVVFIGGEHAGEIEHGYMLNIGA
jgi:hypothetical protein